MDSIKDPWSTVLNDLLSNTCDIALCSILINLDHYIKHKVVHITGIIIESINIATSNGLGASVHHNPLKFLALSLIVFTFIIIIGYTTRYTSLLASPRFSN